VLVADHGTADAPSIRVSPTRWFQQFRPPLDALRPFDFAQDLGLLGAIRRAWGPSITGSVRQSEPAAGHEPFDALRLLEATRRVGNLFFSYFLASSEPAAGHEPIDVA